MPTDIEVFWHGTTELRAARIVSDEQFVVPSGMNLFLAAGFSGHELASIFARRAASRIRGAGGAALVRVEMDAEDAKTLRRLGHLRPKPFDPSDPPELRNQTQWVLHPGAVERFNAYAEVWSVEPVTE